jgi:hypothetical protein
LDREHHSALGFEGTDLPEAIILRSVSGASNFFADVVASIGADLWWFGSVTFSRFAIIPPMFQALSVNAGLRIRESDSGERNPRA